MAVYTTIDNPELYFQTKLYTGNGSSGHAQTFDGDENMQPDLVWMKNRDATGEHFLIDSVRGVTKDIHSNTTAAEGTDANSLTAFGTNGFTVGSQGDINGNTEKMVAWAWKAGTAFSNDASATSIGSVDSSGSVSTTAGFSICSYTGNGTAGATIKHGLDKTPEMLIFKNRTSVITWIVGTKPSSFTTILFLQGTDAATDDNNAFNDTNPSSSVFTLGGNLGTGTNETSSNFICYAFASIQGYSKISKYTANGNADGAYVHLGFRPAFLMIKNITSGSTNWHLYDNKRLGYNVDNNMQRPNLNTADQTDDDLDLLSNGFKIRRVTSALNTDGNNYVYMAFAEQPFVNSNGVPCNAR